MANPNYISDGQGERVDTLVDTSGVGYFKLGVGSKVISGATSNGAGQTIGTHTRGAALSSADPIVAAAGSTPALIVKELLVDTDGALAIQQFLTTPTGLVGVQAAGTLGAGTYYYRISATGATGETLACAEVGTTITITHGVTSTWNAVPGATGYRIYGRTTGAELFIATVGGTTLTYTDSGAITPTGALPTINTARFSGVLEVTQSLKASYVVSVQGVAATAATEIIVIEAPAGNAVRLRRLVIVSAGTQTTGAFVNIQLLRTTTAGTGGTVTPAILDTSYPLGDAAYGGIVRASPTAGTESTVLYNLPLWVPTTGSQHDDFFLDWDGPKETRAPTIPAGTANGIALKHPGATGAASFAAFIEFVVI